MKNAYFSTQEVPPTSVPAPQESTVLLACEQIITEAASKIPKNEQNAIIRLAASVKKYGVLEPLNVKLSTTEHGYPAYLLVDGTRRLRAAMLAGLGKVPCVILPPTDKKCLQMAEITAIKRQNPHYFTMAERFLYLIQTLGMTQEELARKLGLSQSAVANKLRLLQFEAQERHFLMTAELSERHARALLRIRDTQARFHAMTAVARDHLNVAATEALVAEILGENRPQASKMAENAPKTDENSAKDPLYPRQPEEVTSTPSAQTQARDSSQSGQVQGIVPRKFALRDLTPLYNSIERTLGIFKKTGVAADFKKEEDDFAARITIYIPKRG
ncbi:MAG: ParB/RepB/Spo0J family partition protein [Ruminococcaceae bacterium]|nr:ParB/RepB/Spo0J family partition protein [Oscillospiraceae bacterium]